MKLKYTTVATVCLLIYLLAAPSSVNGKSGETDMEMYEIDYRGPETHNSRPPPKNFHGKPPFIHHKVSTVPVPISNNSAGGPAGGNS